MHTKNRVHRVLYRLLGKQRENREKQVSNSDFMRLLRRPCVLNFNNFVFVRHLNRQVKWLSVGSNRHK